MTPEKQVKNIIFVNMACSFRLGSEWDVGWHFFLLLAKHYHIHLIAAEEDRTEIEQLPPALLPCGCQTYYLPANWKLPGQKSKTVLGKQYYFGKILQDWQKRAYGIAQQIIRQEKKIDLVYKLTPCGFREAGEFYKLGIPSLWGPVTGYYHAPVHLILRSDMPLAMRLKFACRDLFSAVKIRFRPETGRAIRGYTEVISGTSSFQSLLSRDYSRKSPLMIQSGIAMDQIADRINGRNKTEPLDVMWCGGLIPRKNLNTVLRTFAKQEIRALPIRLHVAGDGPDMAKAKQLCEDLNLAPDKVFFYGRCSREQVMERMKKAHVFVLLSYSDMAPGVISEAYAAGLPVIALNHEGFSHVVKPEQTGLLIEPVDPEQMQNDLAAALQRFYADEAFRQHCADGALKYAKELSFEYKEQQLIACCEAAMKNFQKKTRKINENSDSESDGLYDSAGPWCHRTEKYDQKYDDLQLPPRLCRGRT